MDFNFKFISQCFYWLWHFLTKWKKWALILILISIKGTLIFALISKNHYILGFLQLGPSIIVLDNPQNILKKATEIIKKPCDQVWISMCTPAPCNMMCKDDFEEFKRALKTIKKDPNIGLSIIWWDEEIIKYVAKIQDMTESMSEKQLEKILEDSFKMIELLKHEAIRCNLISLGSNYFVISKYKGNYRVLVVWQSYSEEITYEYLIAGFYSECPALAKILISVHDGQKKRATSMNTIYKNKLYDLEVEN